MDGLTDFFSGIWDTAKGTFQSWIDYDLQKQNIKVQQQQSAQQSPAYQAAAAWEGQTNLAGLNVPNLLIYASIGVAGLVALKKLKVI